MLNYIVTSNHIHLLVLDTTENVIPRSLQLIAGRTAQEFNLRKKRKGASWEDRYHVTAVETDEHLAKCLVYIDLNMVRAGAVKHPSDYSVSGFNEIQKPPKRYVVIDRKVLVDLFAMDNQERFRQEYRQWVESELQTDTKKRKRLWSESIAVGSQNWLKKYSSNLAYEAKGARFSQRRMGLL